MTRKTTILEELTKPNPVVTHRAKWGTKTTNSQWAAVEGWTLWREFTAEKLYAVLGDLVEIRRLDRSKPSSRCANAVRCDGEIFDEDELEHSRAHLLRTRPEGTADSSRTGWALCASDSISTFEAGRELSLL
ncbi:hypothetical protein B0H66DRAFT_269695 [Apodospora peruviana]|uniref:Uncharacterized protein n=1 Tax=Apodospora peruviana TaxID=516989 RepID=A0AAE0HZE7_9PEZI|nr:hypothetical protein B0H66DRAFT_269695 [Apodospora peruviana]